MLNEKTLDSTRALKDAENALRDFIAQTLEHALGKDWEIKCGVTEERLSKWHARKKTEAKRQETGTTEERLIYYADFYDLKTILKKHWGQYFTQALGDLRTMEVLLDELEKLRDSDAHRRELLPHQHHFVLGLSGEIRTRIIRYRSTLETGESYFPQIESARDSLGNIYTAGSIRLVITGKSLRPGDSLDFVITACDPLESELYYGFGFFSSSVQWKQSISGSITVEKSHVGIGKMVKLYVISPREFHAHDGYDDSVTFTYDILPPLG